MKKVKVQNFNTKNQSKIQKVQKFQYEIGFMSQHSGNKSQQFTRKKIEEYSYGLNDVIGKGYSSQVYKGRHDHTEEPVAVKVIDMKMLKNEINRHLLESQIDILKEIKNVPNVLKFHQVYTTKNNTYIVTELCSSDLNKKISQKLTEAEAYHFMDQVVLGYLEIYQKQIVHRDLKPANILLTETDECKIADFGFAIKNEQLSKPSKYNVGSPLYMAPESLKKNEYSYKTDLWSLGVIFFELLTGQTPWKSKTEKDLLRKMEIQTIESVIHRKKLNFSSKTVDFLVRCLCIDLNKRLSPEELRKYTFGDKIPNNILTEAKLNFPTKKTTLKHLNSSIPPPLSKPFQRQTFNTLQTPSSKNVSQKMLFNTTIKFNQTQELSSNNKTQTQNQKIKMISKQLISEIHFCRLLFKLIQKIKDSQKNGILRDFVDEIQKIEKKFTQFIRHKVDNLTHFSSYNFLQVDQSAYSEYKSCSDYKKIIKIALEYKQRYQIELKQNWNLPFDKKFTTNQTILLVKKMIQVLDKERDVIYKNITQYEKDVIILDYLITVKQLLQMLVDGQNYEKFTRKSKIQDIVEGTTSIITQELYQKIVQRGKQIVLC